MPGFLHLKDPTEPFLVRARWKHEVAYTERQVADAFPWVPDKSAHEQALRFQSGQVLLELARRGISREQAYEWVQRNAMRSFDEKADFKSLVLTDPDITNVLTPHAIDKAFDLGEQLRNVDAIFARVFSEGRRQPD